MQSTKSRPGLAYYKDGILHRDRVVLAQAITLIESTLDADTILARQLINELIAHAGNSLRIGITGAPGVGKSSFIECFGNHVISQGKTLAVLTIDPSSQQSGGSILGDKTRMDSLSRNPGAFIRPSPSGNTLGGVAEKTRETIIVCEAAGFDVIIIETVGVGQSETMVKNMVDFFLLLLQSGGGDELQGIKKGIVEIADALVITKADGDNLALARKTQAEYQQALHVLSANDVDPRARVLTASSITGDGIPEIWTNMISFLDHAKASGHFDRNRTNQNLNWFNDLFRYLLHQQLNRSPEFQQKIESLNERILQKNISPTDAAVQLLSFLNTTSGV